MAHTPRPTFRECTQDERIDKLEDRIYVAETRLHTGDLGFAELRKDVAHLAEKVSILIETIRSAVTWALGTVGTVVAGAIVWAIVQRGHP